MSDGILKRAEEEVIKNELEKKKLTDEQILTNGMNVTSEFEGASDIHAEAQLTLPFLTGYKIQYNKNGPKSAVAFIFKEVNTEILKFFITVSKNDDIKKPLLISDNIVIVSNYSPMGG